MQDKGGFPDLNGIEVARQIRSAVGNDMPILLMTAYEGRRLRARLSPRATTTRGRMDVHMPMMNGYEVTRAIRVHPDAEKAKVPIVAMTANAFDEDKKATLESGMNAHIAKPIDEEQVLLVIAEVTRR